MAIDVWNMLENGSKALDWAGLPLAVERFGIRDVEGLLKRLDLIKRFTREQKRE